MKLNWKLLRLLVVGATLAVSARATDKNGALFPDQVLVKGKGIEVKQSDLDVAVATVKADAVSSGRELPADQLPVIEIKLLDHLAMVQMLKPKANDAQRARAAQESERRTALIKKQFGSEDLFLHQLTARGMTMEQFHSRLQDEALFEIMLREKISVTDAQIKKYYDENPARFEEPELVRASHIVLRSRDPKSGAELGDDDKRAKRKVLQDLLKRARAGEDFAKLAREFSEDPGAKDNGGEYKFARGTLGLPEFDAAAFSLQTNQVSDIVTTSFGYHIIKLHEKIPPHHVELAKVTTELRAFLERVEIEKLLPGYYEALKKEAGVEFLDEKHKALEAKVAELAAKTARDAAKALDTPEKAK